MKDLKNFPVKELSSLELKEVQGGFLGPLFAFLVGAAIAIIGTGLQRRIQ